MAAIGPNRQFLGGDEPNLADLVGLIFWRRIYNLIYFQSLYGAMNSFYGCSAFKEVILEEKIAEWWRKMDALVKNHDGRKALESRSQK